MAVKVKWTGNAANLPKERKNDTTPTVRYVGMGSGGNAYQPYTKAEDNTARTVTVEDTKRGGEAKNTDRVVGSPGGTFLGGFSYKGKSRREKTAAEIAQEQEQAAAGYKEYKRLATMDLNAQEAAVAAAKEKAAQSREKYNIHAFGAYDSTPTKDESEYSRLLADLNKAKSIQYDIKGRKELDALTAEQTDALDRLSKASRPQTSAMATNQASEAAALKAKSELEASGLSDEKIRELLGYHRNIPKREKNAETFEDIQGAAEAYAETNPALATVASVGTNLASGVGAIGAAFEHMLDPDTPVDYHGGAFLPYAYTSGVRDTVSKNLETDHGKAASFAYGVGTSMLDSAATVGLTVAGVPAWLATSTLGGAAATSAMQEAKDRGLDDDRAIWTGLLAGVAESAFEKISLENLITMKAPTGTVRQKILGTLKNTAKQAGIEGSEEVFTDFANLISDGIINGNMSQLRQAMDGYVAEGMTEAEARDKAIGDWIKDTAVDFAAGALAGGLMGGASNAVSRISQNAEAGREYDGREQELLDESKELNPDNDLAKKYQERLDNGKKLSGRQLMRLIEQNETDTVASDKAKIQSAAEGRLAQLGETGDAAQIAQAITKQVVGEKLSTAEQSLIDGSRFGRRVANEIDPENVKAVVTKDGITPRDTFASEWTGKLDTKRIYPEVFNRLMPQAQKTRETTARQEGEVTGAKYNAETGRLDAIVTNEAGEVKTVPAAEAEMTPMQEELFDWADELKLEAAGPLMVRAYQPEQNMELYTRSFKLAYEYGKAGMPMDYVEKSEGVNYLHPTQIKLAYEEGQAATQRKVQAREEKIRSGGTTDSTTKKKGSVSLRGAKVGSKTYAPVNRKTVDSRQWASVKAMRAFSRAVGVDVVFYQSQANERGVYEGANGFYKGGKLYLDINAGRDTTSMTETAILKTAAHELNHFIQANSAQYEALKSFVVNKLTHEEGVSLEDLVADKQRREPGLEYNEAVDEVVADACEMMLKNSTVVEQLAKENRSLAEKIRDWLREWVENLKLALEGLQADRTESRTMMQYARELQEIWDNALMDAARNNRGTAREAAPAESRQSIRETNNGKKYVKADRQVLFGSDPDSWSEQLEDYINGKIRRGQDVQLIAEDGDILLLTRTSAGKLSDNHTGDGRTMSDAAFERKANAAAHIDELVKVSSKGKKTVIDKDARHGDMASGGWNYRTAYFMDFDGKYYKTTISVAEGSGGSIVYNVGHMKEEAFPKIKGSYAEKGNGPRGNTSTNSIRQSNDNSQEKSSDKVQSSMRDSVGRELTEAQQAYFKDSKVRDADGKLKPVYHGSAAIFTEFSADFMSQNGSSEGQGFYFTDYKPMAQGYEKNGGQLLEGYLDIKKPLSDSEVTLTAAEVKRLIRAVDPTGDDLVLNYDSRGGLGYPSRAWYNRSVEDTLRATMSTSDSDSEILAELANGMGDPGKVLKTVRELLGYDGYIVEGKYDNATVYVAFDSSQFKNADNKKPTADPDIRYQQRDSDKTGDWDENGNPIFDNTPVRVEEATDFAEVKRRRKAAVEDYGLEKNESMRIESYVSGLAYELNKRMNSGILSEQDQNYADKVRDAFRKFPQYKGTTFRNLSFGSKKALEKFLLEHKKGEVIKLKAFTSTSKSPNGYKVSGEFIVHMEFRGESNADISETYGLPRQQEVVYMPGTEIRVSDVTTANDGNPFIIVEEVGIHDQRANIGAEKSAGGMESNRENGRYFTGGENEFGDGVRRIERDRHAGNDALSERGKSDPGRTLTDSDVKNQQRDPRLSDRDVLRMAADMAQRDRSQRWSVEDLNRFDLLQRKLLQLDEANAELEALKEERKVLLAGRKVKELTRDEQFDLAQNRNRTETQKGKIQRLEEETYKIESVPQVKALLKKSRSIVERAADSKARAEFREAREKQEILNTTRRKVERNAKRLLEYMNTNTDKKRIPEALKKPIGELLESLDFYSNSARKGGNKTRADQRYCEAMQGLQSALAAQKLFDDTGEGTDLFKGYLDLPAGFESMLGVHVERVKTAMEKHPLKTDIVRKMDLDDLRDLDVILSVMSRSVTQMNEMFVNRRFAYVADAAEDSIESMDRLGQHQDKAKGAEQFALWDNTLPWYAFQRFGEGGKAVFEGLQDGWDKLAFNMKTVLDFRQELIKDTVARKWDTETHKVELTDPDGATVTTTLTTAQLMSLYCLSKRKQALGHLLGGGIRPAAIELTDTLGDRVRKRSLTQDKQYKLTDESLGQLLKLLTPEQKKIADAMQKFMTEQGSAWGNAVTMARFGYRGFTEQNYFPIETDAQDRQAKTGDTKEGSLYRLQNISAVKPLVKNANNALILRGIFDVFANHTADMAKYNAMVLPIIDAQKWYNYKYASKNEAGQVSTRTVQRAMTRAYGGAANNYVIKYMQDLNGVKETGDRGTDWQKKMISNYKRAMVAANMRVALLQPTAYVRASAVLDYKYLVKAFADKTGTKQATKEMLENSGIALWKSLGFFDTDVGRSVRDQIKGKSGKLENLVDKTMIPAEKGDEITWARLWRACKLEVQDKQSLTGDELLKATAERFREVVYRTQVVDSTMTRSHMMRGSGTLSKMTTSFMSEPTVSYNMVMESTRQIAEDAKRLGMRVALRRNWKVAGRAYQAYIVSAVVTAIVESLYDALRDSDDDDYLDKVWKAFGGEKPETVKDGILNVIFGLNGNLAGDINPIGKVPYLRDVVSILGGYSNGRMDTEAAANLKKAVDIWDEVIRLQTGDLDKATKTTYYGNMTTYGMIYPTAKALSQLTGLPGSAAMREIVTVWNSTVGAAWPNLKRRTYENKQLREAWEKYGKASGVSYAVMYRATQDTKDFESDKDADGNTISGSLKAKYVEYIRSLGLPRAQEKAVWEAAKVSSWSDKGTPWG
nr:MAG TPA: ADP-ribosyl-(Dinitrogen reductase) hydrolase [Caudoviricetes sp.]